MSHDTSCATAWCGRWRNPRAGASLLGLIRPSARCKHVFGNVVPVVLCVVAGGRDLGYAIWRHGIQRRLGWFAGIVVVDDLSSTLVDQQHRIFGFELEWVVLFQGLGCAFNAVIALDMGNGLDVVDHQPATRQADAKRLGDVAFGHGSEPRLLSRAVFAMSVGEQAQMTRGGKGSNVSDMLS